MAPGGGTTGGPAGAPRGAGRTVPDVTAGRLGNGGAQPGRHARNPLVTATHRVPPPRAAANNARVTNLAPLAPRPLGPFLHPEGVKVFSQVRKPLNRNLRGVSPAASRARETLAAVGIAGRGP